METRPCELRADCGLARLHYHVLDQIFYDMDELREVYPDELPIKDDAKGWLPVGPATTMPVDLNTPGIEWDGKRGSVVMRRDENGDLIPVGVAITGTATPGTISVATSGIFKLPGDLQPARSSWP